MAVTFNSVPSVSAGDPITSTQMAALAEGFNQRLRSGLGNNSQRIFQYFFNLWRNVRRPADANTFPAQAEFIQFYMLVEPHIATWPEVGPDLPEGANTANHMMGFVYGRPDLADEVFRLAQVPLWLGVDPPLTDVDKWQVGKLQRGVTDPTTGSQFVPAFEYAQSYFKVLSNPLNSHGRSYGGFPPVPEVLGDCANGYERNYRYKFTSLTGLADKVYSGSCSENSGDVQYISRTPFAYYVHFYDGTYERLDFKEWVEGPYTFAGDIQKPDGNHLTRMLNAFLHDFRGTESEREETNFSITDTGFQFQKFLTTQYYLSPNIGHVDGGELVVDYPLFRWTGATTIAADTLATHTQSATTEHEYTDGYVFSGFYVEQSKLVGNAQIEVLSGSTIIDRFSVNEGDAPRVKMYPAPTTPTPLKFKLTTAANFTDTDGFIAVECLEQLAYLPELHDAYLVLRLMATDGEPLDSVDGGGLDETKPKLLSDTYFSKGIIVNTATPQAVPQSTGLNGVNNNPVFDAARRLTRDNIRHVSRLDLIGYEVTEGKSILYFKRYHKGLQNIDIDNFLGLAPDADGVASDSLVIGETYIIRSGVATHDGTDYEAGETFTATLTTYTGTAEVLVYEGIRTTALPSDWTNEWILDIASLPYHWSQSSLWKPEAYSDFFAYLNRCHFDAPSNELSLNNNRDLYLHFEGSITGGTNAAPVSLDAYNYIGDINSDFSGVRAGGGPLNSENRDQFYKSCQIYKTPYVIESATSYQDSGEVVKLVLSGRLQHSETAPASISKDFHTWDHATIYGEAYRTDENAIREYLLHFYTGKQCQPLIGDNAAAADIQTESDNPFGSCYPKFYFTRLVPKPYEDGNDTVQRDHDALGEAKTWLQMDVYLRAMCEGWVDGQSSANWGCAGLNKPGLFDYTFENLCLDAFGGRWLSPISTTLRPLTEGFGPLPYTVPYADIYNQFATCLNKLDKVRVELPTKIECKDTNYNDIETITPDWDPIGSCGTSGTHKAVDLDRTPSGANTLNFEGPWSLCSLVVATSFAAFEQECDGSDWQFGESRDFTEYRFRLTDDQAIHAIPILWRDMFGDANTGILAHKITTVITPSAEEVSVSGDAQGCGATPTGFFFDSGTGYAFSSDEQETIECGLFTAGSLNPGAPPAGDFYRGVNGSEFCSNFSQRSIQLEPIADQVASFLKVPLV